ncbi:MAG: rsmH 1, partial [Verrucomicrobiales bacterium]|nr:rsmH 1 [Verrucomicrobiales bacterium]
AALPRILGEQGLISGVDLILADLGVSSMQLDDPARGFSFKAPGPLDLRMNPQKGSPASALIAKATEEQLMMWMRENADEPHAIHIARAIIERRAGKPITTTNDLRQTIETALRSEGRRAEPREILATTARVFQALRIAVNDELTALDTFLRFLPDCLKSGGRVAILTFHSGEDRRVKKAFSAGNQAGVYRSISGELIRPGSSEIESNSRASSAKLRWAERT